MSTTIYQGCTTAYTDTDRILQCVSEGLQEENEVLNSAIGIFFLLYASALVFFMQAGFAMLCAGSVRQKNVQNTMLKNVLDACTGAISFWAVGFAFAYGGSINLSDDDDKSVTFIGSENFFMEGLDDFEIIFWLFQFAFAATSATIVAGTLAERCQMVGYMLYSVTLTGFIYPVVVHAIWSRRGFLSPSAEDPLFDIGMLDFAGSGVVHVTGGIASLLASIILGPRKGRFFDERTGMPLDEPKEILGHSASLQVLGTFILWFSWYGFNPGSVQTLRGGGASVASLAAVTTTLSAAAGGVTSLATDTILAERRTGEATFNLQACLNGCLSGLVAITAGCAVVEPWAATVIGVISGWVYLWSSNALVKWRIDDAVDAIPVHLANGIWGVIATGLFARGEHIEVAFNTDASEGIFYDFSNFKLLAAQLCGLLFIIGWVSVLMGPFFLVLNYLGWFRADPLEEVVGLDISYHGGNAYDFDTQPKLESFDLTKSGKKSDAGISRSERLRQILENQSNIGGPAISSPHTGISPSVASNSPSEDSFDIPSDLEAPQEG